MLGSGLAASARRQRWPPPPGPARPGCDCPARRCRQALGGGGSCLPPFSARPAFSYCKEESDNVPAPSLPPLKADVPK